MRPRIKKYLDEFNLEIDDIRWYLCKQIGGELLSYASRTRELTEFIWSGRLSDSLHDLEDRHLDSIDDALTVGTMDDAQARLFFLEVKAARRRRMGR